MTEECDNSGKSVLFENSCSKRVREEKEMLCIVIGI